MNTLLKKMTLEEKIGQMTQVDYAGTGLVINKLNDKRNFTIAGGDGIFKNVMVKIEYLPPRNPQTGCYSLCMG